MIFCCKKCIYNVRISIYICTCYSSFDIDWMDMRIMRNNEFWLFLIEFYITLNGVYILFSKNNISCISVSIFWLRNTNNRNITFLGNCFYRFSESGLIEFFLLRKFSNCWYKDFVSAYDCFSSYDISAKVLFSLWGIKIVSQS